MSWTPPVSPYHLYGLLYSKKKEKELNCKDEETTKDLKKKKKGSGPELALAELAVGGLYPTSRWPASPWTGCP
jgi:hypothetical protein